MDILTVPEELTQFGGKGVSQYGAPIFIDIEEPLIGAKAVCLRDPGMYVLEAAPVLFRGMACTHAGSGGVAIYDGVPDQDGYFPELPELPEGEENDPMAKWNRNGRLIYYAHPACMGMWMLDAGCRHGLTIVMQGTEQVSPIVTLTWMKHKARK